MKGIISLLLVSIFFIMPVGCDRNSNDHEDEAKTLSASSVQKGRDYKDVIKDF